MRVRNLAAAVFAAAAFFALPAAASAADICVGASPLCPVDSGQTYASAVSTANTSAGLDRIFLAAGDYTATGTLSFSGDVEIIGAGVGKTVFRGSASTVAVGFQFSTSASTVSGITAEVEGNPSNAVGISISNGRGEDLQVLDKTGGAASNLRGISVTGGAVVDGVEVGLVSQGSALLMQSGDGRVIDGTFKGAGGAGLNGSTSGTVRVDRSSFSGFSTGALFDFGTLILNDSVVDMADRINATGISTYNSSSSVINVTVRRTTVVGTGGSQKALRYGTGTGTFTGEFDDLLLYPTGSNSEALRCDKGSGTVTTSLATSAFSFAQDFYAVGCTDDSGTNGNIDAATAPPVFVDAQNADYRQSWNSPLIDAGSDGSVLDPSPKDRGGKSRLVNGDDSGAAAIDPGAYEYQRAAPVVTIDPASPTVELLQAFAFTATASDPDGDELTYAWEIDGAPANGTTASLSGGFISLGGHTVKVTATDSTGLSASATANVTVTPKADPPVTPPTAAKPTVKVTAKPKKSFKIGKQGFAVAKKGAASFSVQFSDSAKAKFTLQSIGRKNKLKSLKGSQTLTVKNGTSKFSFGGTWNKKKLAVGRYRLTITPLSAAGSAGKPVTVDLKTSK